MHRKTVLKLLSVWVILLLCTEAVKADLTCEEYGYTGNNRELYRTPNAACASNNIYWYPTFTYAKFTPSFPDAKVSGGSCWHRNPGNGSLHNIVNYAVRCVSYGIIPKAPEQCANQPREGNPCNPATGEKFQSEHDFSLPGSPLRVIRKSSTQSNESGYESAGIGWRLANNRSMRDYGTTGLNHQVKPKSVGWNNSTEACIRGWKGIKDKAFNGLLYSTEATKVGRNCIIKDQSGATIVTLKIHDDYVQGTSTNLNENTTQKIIRPNGSVTYFKLDENGWIPEENSSESLVVSNDRYIYTTSSGAVEVYDSSGNLLEEINAKGQTTYFEYDARGKLIKASDGFGNTLLYSYNHNEMLTSIETPTGTIHYTYDWFGKLDTVTYPEGVSKKYHYENTQYRNLLTGITDENGNRYATWAYDNQGRAILSEHAGGAERVEFAYNDDGSTTVTDANGAQRTYHFVIARNTLKVSHITGDQCKTCPNGHIQAYTYDSSGFIATETDWEGHMTHYTRDPQGRELTRVEAYGTPEARTISTLWNTALNKPAQITYPDRKEIYTYNEQGLLIKTEHLPLTP